MFEFCVALIRRETKKNEIISREKRSWGWNTLVNSSLAHLLARSVSDYFTSLVNKKKTIRKSEVAFKRQSLCILFFSNVHSHALAHDLCLVTHIVKHTISSFFKNMLPRISGGLGVVNFHPDCFSVPSAN
jgi:hypothetical protein